MVTNVIFIAIFCSIITKILVSLQLKALMSCCGKKKHFLSELLKTVGAVMLLAVGENEASLEVTTVASIFYVIRK